jgi:hypothetical protein
MWQAIYHELRRWAKVSRAAAAAYRRTEITVETDQILIIRKSHSERGWCAECGREVDMVGVNDAGELTGRIQHFVGRPSTGQPSSTLPMLPGCGDSWGWHWSQAADGSPRVCLESVLTPGSGSSPKPQ